MDFLSFKKTFNRDYLICVGICGLQLINIPGLSDVHMLGKIFLLSFAVLVSLGIFACRRDSLATSPVVLLMWIALAGFLGGAWFAKNMTWSLYYVAILGVFLVFFTLFLDFCANRSTVQDHFLDVLLLFGVIVSSLGLYEYISFYALGPTKSMLIPYLMPSVHSSRVSGPYGQANITALFLGIVLVGFLKKYLHHGKEFANRSGLLGVLCFLPFALVALVFFQTGSRAILLSLTLILAIILFRVMNRSYLRTSKESRRTFYCLVGLFFCMMAFHYFIDLALSSDGLSVFEKRFLGSGYSSEGRFVFWTSALLIFLDHPWVGVGLDGYRFFQNDYGPLSHDLLGFVRYGAMGNTNWAHNEFLQLLCEGGIFVFLLIMVLFFLYLFNFKKVCISRREIENHNLFYAYLFVLPFIVHSAFEWPLRHPGSLLLFFTFCAFLLKEYRFRHLSLSWGARAGLVCLSVVSLFLLTHLVILDVRYASFLKDIRTSTNKFETFDEFEYLVQKPYLSYRALWPGLKYYTPEALADEDKEVALKILPYFERLCELEGVNIYWYNLSLLYFKAGMENESRTAVKRAIELMPMNEKLWSFLHYLNARKISRKTGLPVENYLPKPGEANLESLMNRLKESPVPGVK